MLGPEGDQPVPELARRGAVNSVVSLDLVENFLVPQLQPALKGDDAVKGGADRIIPSRSIEALHVLKRVPRLANSQALPDHDVEVHESLLTQEGVELRFAGCVTHRQPLQGGQLVMIVMV